MPEWVLLLATVPVVTGFIGWVTNWAAVKMIFHPERFIGIGRVGWRAILHKQAHKFAQGVADMVTENLLSARELAERLDPEDMERVFADTLDEQTVAICRDATEIVRPGAWDGLPEPVRAMIVTQVKAESRKLVHELFVELQGISDQVLDLEELVYGQLSGENTRRLVRLTRKIGRKEFTFIEYYGGVFGFLIGMLQIGVWTSMQTWWLMPIVGVAVGLATNWLAIKMIFRPQEPKKYVGLVTYQGLFAKRQPEIAADYGQVAADEIITPKNLLRLVTEGEAGSRIAALVTGTISSRLDSELTRVQGMLPVEVTDEQVAAIKALIVRRITETAPAVQPRLEAYLEQKLDVQRTVEDRLANLPKPDFERVLRGIFEEDEITLILVGGVLGGAVGALQGLALLTM